MDNVKDEKKSGFFTKIISSLKTNISKYLSFSLDNKPQSNLYSNPAHQAQNELNDTPSLVLNENIDEHPYSHSENENNSEHKEYRHYHFHHQYPSMNQQQLQQKKRHHVSQNNYNKERDTHSILSQKTPRHKEANDANMSTQSKMNSIKRMKMMNTENNINESSMMNITLRSLDDIKSEINAKRKEANDKLQNLKQKSFFSNINDDLSKEFDERKRILTDYYQNKVNQFKEITLQMEKERLKREDNFNHLSRSNSSFVVKGKEKKLNLSIKKGNDLFFEKSQTKTNNKEEDIKGSNFSFGLSQSNPSGSGGLFASTTNNDNNKVQEEKQQQQSSLTSSSLFSKPVTTSNTNGLFGSGLTNAKEEKKEDTKIFGSGLFSTNATTTTNVSNNNKDTNKPLFGFGNETKPQEQKPLSNESKSLGLFKSNEPPSNNNNNNNQTNTSTSLFGKNDNNNNTNQGLFGLGDKTTKTNEGEKKETTSLFGNNAAKSNEQKETKSLFGNVNATTEGNALFSSNKATTKDAVANVTPSPGSLLNDQNPFLSQNTNTNISNVFKSPSKNTNSGAQQGSSLFGGNNNNGGAQTQPLFGAPASTQQTSLFEAKHNPTVSQAPLFGSNTGNNNNQQPSLFGSNTGNTNINNNQPTLFGSNTGTSNQTPLFGSNTGTTNAQQPSLFGSNTGNIGTTTNQTSLFGTNTGNTGTNNQPTLFGTNNNQTSLFGTNTGTNNTQQPSLFGSNTGNTGTTTNQTSLFGTSTNTNNQPSLFGSNTGTNIQQPSTGLFGSNPSGIQQTPSLFGTNNGGTQPVSSLFGSSNTVKSFSFGIKK